MQGTIALKPFHVIDIPHWKYFYRKINWLWWIQRSPMFLLALPAAYGVGAYAYYDGHLPLIVAIIAGTSFEATYMGTIALGDQMDSDDKTGFWIWVCLSIIAVLCSMIANVLFFSGGKYAGITLESITHGAPLSVLNFFYGLLLHHISSHTNKKQIEVTREKEAEAAKKAEMEKFHCEYCNLGRPTKQAIYGHYKYCAEKKAGKAKQFTLDGVALDKQNTSSV